VADDLSAKKDESSIPGAKVTSYTALYPALSPSGGEGGSSTSHHTGEQPTCPSGHGQPSNRMGEMNPSGGIPTSPTPTTATHAKMSEVSVGTDPLFSPTSHGHGHPQTASLQRR